MPPVPTTMQTTTSSMLKLVIVMVVWVSHPATAALLDEPIQPIPPTLKQDPARAEIGRLLFRDTRLSGNGSVSCVSCHDLGKGGVDGRAHSMGLNGGLTDVNTPTVFNAAPNFKQFWNGRADSLESQIDHVMQSPVEMGSKWEEVVQKVSQDAKYKSAFAVAYKDCVTKVNIRNAIATFERTLNALAAKQMGGTLTAHSDGPGQGAIFTLELPFESESARN